MNKLDGKTSDIIKDNIQKLKELFPEVISESKIDFDTLRQYLGDEVEEREERYSFNWHGKKQAISMAIGQSTGTLRPDKESSKDWDTTKNLFIEGDNLEVMRILRNTYLGKVKMIYIDPPYNTGRDFVYTDNFKDNLGNYTNKTGQNFVTNPETNGRYHTNWLNMMYPRLRMAKDLLRDDGVIFISIDDNEVHNLRKICDEIFGEENFLGEFIRRTRSGGGFGTSDIGIEHDYIICFSKSRQAFLFNKLKKDDEELKKYFNKSDEKGPYHLRELRQSDNQSGRREDRPFMFFGFTVNNGKIGLIEEEDYKEIYKNSKFNDDLIDKLNEKYPKIIWPIRGDKSFGRWGCGYEKARLLLNQGNLHCIGDKVFNKERIDVDREEKVITTLLTENRFTNTGASMEFKQVLDNSLFDFPKPVSIINLLSSLSTNKNSNDIILDFFAGSGTTAHAVMQLNAEDGGNRKYIMVQLDEETDEKSEAYKAGYKSIAELSRERIRRAGEKIITDNADKLAERESPLDIGFKAFRLDSTNLNIWDGKTDNIAQSLNFLADNPIKENRTEQDIIYEILLKAGIDITIPIQESIVANTTLYSIAGNMVMICLTHHLTEDIIQAIAEAKPEKIVVYDNAFINDAAKLNAEKIWTDAGVNDIRTI